jgi:hypothetical protein
MRKTLIAFRLFDSTYGPQGNPKTLFVNLREDNTLSYVFIGGWQNSGTGFAISNLQLKESLPLGARSFKTVKALQKRIAEILATGCGSNKIKSFEILNDLNTVSLIK